MSSLGSDVVRVLFVSTLEYGKMMVEAAYGHGNCVALVVLIAVGNREDAVDVVFAEPGLHDNLCRANLMHLVIRRCFTATVTGCGLVQKPCDSAGKHWPASFMNVHVQDRDGSATGRRNSFSELRDDFGARIRHAWPDVPVAALAPMPNEPATSRLVLRSGVEWSRRADSGSRADRPRELPPRGEPRADRGQVQHDAAHRVLDPDGELDQPLAQRGDLRVRTGGAAGAALEFLEEHVGGQAQEDAELVGQKPRAAGPVHVQPVMQLLEPILHIAPLAVDLLVDCLRRTGEVGHDEPGIVLGVAAGILSPAARRQKWSIAHDNLGSYSLIIIEFPVMSFVSFLACWYAIILSAATTGFSKLNLCK